MNDQSLVPVSLDHPDQWGLIKDQGSILAKAGLIKGTTTMEACAVKVWFGREIGLSAPMAISEIHFVEGKPTLGVNAMMALLSKGGVTWEVGETEDSCEIKFRRKGWKPILGSFTMKEARAAELTSKGVWKKYQRAMLYARAFTLGARRIAADLLNGCLYTPEELGKEVDEDGAPFEMIQPPKVNLKSKPEPKPEPETEPGTGKAVMITAGMIRDIEKEFRRLELDPDEINHALMSRGIPELKAATYLQSREIRDSLNKIPTPKPQTEEDE